MVWLTGPPAAGKTTIAQQVSAALRSRGGLVEVLDGDAMRAALSRELGFSRSDRDTHVRRVATVAHLLARNGVTVVVAMVSPYRATRAEVRGTFPHFIEVHVTAPRELLASRDPKGLYRKAAAGELTGLTGVDDPYEPPLRPDVLVDTSVTTVAEAVKTILRAIGRDHTAHSGRH